MSVAAGAVPRRLTSAATTSARSSRLRARSRSIAMPASRWTPSSAARVACFARGKPIAVGADRAGEDQREPVAPFSRSCSACGIGGAGSGWSTRCMTVQARPACARQRAARRLSRIERLDGEPVIGLGDQSLLERRALEHALDQLAPLLAGCRRKFGGQRQVVGGVGHPVIKCHDANGRRKWRCKWRANRCTVIARGGSRSIPVVSTCARASRTVMPRDHPLRRDLGERHQHEGALEQARVRQRQVRRRPGEIVIGEEVDVDRARTPAALLGCGRGRARARPPARAPASACGRQAGFDRNAEIDERRLVRDAPGRRAIVRGTREQADLLAVAEAAIGAVERVAHVADIAAERDQRFSHVT